jgi:hypothetical protein
MSDTRLETRRTAAVVFLALLCVFAGFIAAQAHSKAGGRDAQTASSYPAWYYNPEWWLAIAAIPSLWFIGKQWEATAKAAKAASDSAKAAVGSERAWIMVELEPAKNAFQIWQESKGQEAKYTHVNVLCICTNHGKTPAKITEISAAAVILEEVGTTYTLPETLDRTKLIEEMSGIEIVAAPVPFKTSLGIVCHGSRKVGLTLVVYGVVKYKHVFSEEEVETTFGYRITPGDQLVRLSDRPAYNENT